MGRTTGGSKLSRSGAGGKGARGAIAATGFWAEAGKVPAGFDPAFAHGFFGWTASKSGSAAAFSFRVKPYRKYLVAVGYFDPNTKPGQRLQRVVVDGKTVETMDPAGPTPFVRLYEATDLNGDGYIQVSCSQAIDESGATGLMNIVWVFDETRKSPVKAEDLARGTCRVEPLYRMDWSTADRKPREHVHFPKLPASRLKKMLPLRPVALDLDPSRPQPADPRNLEIRGELLGRIRRVLDRWGFAGRDQKWVAGFLADAGFETCARSFEVFCMFSRLLKIDLDLEVPFEALLSKQARSGPDAGAFLGGEGTPRLACSWEQGIMLQAMIAYFEHSGGDPRAMEAAALIVDWEDRVTTGQITVGSWGAGGKYGALEGLTNYVWRTHDAKALEIAKRIVETVRKPCGVAWMMGGEPVKDHLHSCLTTVRGLPWLYALTGDRSYLDEAIAAFDRIADESTWVNGCVEEMLPPEAPHRFPEDEACCTADEIMLSYQLADLTGETRFLDRADTLYMNGLRFHQWFDGNFNSYNDPYYGLKGPHTWYCCTWWGAKAMYETARHLYASTASEVFVNGFMPSKVEVSVAGGAVRLATTANIPVSGDVKIVVTPKGSSDFAVNVRVPGWAVLRGIDVGGRPIEARASNGYVAIRRKWQAGDRVDVHFDLPLRVALDHGQGPRPLAEGLVGVDGAPAAKARSVAITRGPALIALFRLQGGCDLVWAYSGDDPHLFETLESVPDSLELGGASYRPTGVPDLVEVAHTPSGVKLSWVWKTGPQGKWEVRRSALVKSGLPLRIEYEAEVVPPAGAKPAEVAEALRTGRFCGTRMQYGVSETFTYFDKPGARVAPNIVDNGRSATLDSGSVQFRVVSARPSAGSNEGEANYSAIYATLAKRGGRLTAKCRLKVTGQSQFD